MSLSDVRGVDREIAFECLTYIARSSCFWDAEFDVRLGMSKTELIAVLDAWPEIDDASRDSNGNLAVNNCFNEVCNGLSITGAEWRKWFSVPADRVREAFTC